MLLYRQVVRFMLLTLRRILLTSTVVTLTTIPTMIPHPVRASLLALLIVSVSTFVSQHPLLSEQGMRERTPHRVVERDGHHSHGMTMVPRHLPDVVHHLPLECLIMVILLILVIRPCIWGALWVRVDRLRPCPVPLRTRHHTVRILVFPKRKQKRIVQMWTFLD